MTGDDDDLGVLTFSPDVLPDLTAKIDPRKSFAEIQRCATAKISPRII
jgi:hypothetical protein